MPFFAGIGSRQTPPEICSYMAQVSTFLEFKGYTLRSGGAPGADQAFEAGIADPSHKQIYRPKDVTLEAMEIASQVHPAWEMCNTYARQLHGRNVFQILGADLQTPVNFVVCWTLGAQPVGGTRTAIVLAGRHNIPVHNLADPDQVQNFSSFLSRL